MTTEIVSITHSNEGIRINWPDSQADVFANPVYLAESYARVRRQTEHARKQLVETVAEKLNTLDKILDDEGTPQAELRELREAVTEAARILS